MYLLIIIPCLYLSDYPKNKIAKYFFSINEKSKLMDLFKVLVTDFLKSEFIHYVKLNCLCFK